MVTLYCTDPAQHLEATGYDLDDLDRDLFDVRNQFSTTRQSPSRIITIIEIDMQAIALWRSSSQFECCLSQRSYI